MTLSCVAGDDGQPVELMKIDRAYFRRLRCLYLARPQPNSENAWLLATDEKARNRSGSPDKLSKFRRASDDFKSLSFPRVVGIDAMVDKKRKQITFLCIAICAG